MRHVLSSWFCLALAAATSEVLILLDGGIAMATKTRFVNQLADGLRAHFNSIQFSVYADKTTEGATDCALINTTLANYWAFVAKANWAASGPHDPFGAILYHLENGLIDGAQLILVITDQEYKSGSEPTSLRSLADLCSPSVPYLSDSQIKSLVAGRNFGFVVDHPGRYNDRLGPNAKIFDLSSLTTDAILREVLEWSTSTKPAPLPNPDEIVPTTTARPTTTSTTTTTTLETTTTLATTTTASTTTTPATTATTTTSATTTTTTAATTTTATTTTAATVTTTTTATTTTTTSLATTTPRATTSEDTTTKTSTTKAVETSTSGGSTPAKAPTAPSSTALPTTLSTAALPKTASTTATPGSTQSSSASTNPQRTSSDAPRPVTQNQSSTSQRPAGTATKTRREESAKGLLGGVAGAAAGAALLLGIAAYRVVSGRQTVAEELPEVPRTATPIDEEAPRGTVVDITEMDDYGSEEGAHLLN